MEAGNLPMQKKRSCLLDRENGFISLPCFLLIKKVMRILRHRQMRAGKGFETVERYTDLKGLKLDPDSVVLLECMSNLTANEMFQERVPMKELWKQ